MLIAYEIYNEPMSCNQKPLRSMELHVERTIMTPNNMKSHLQTLTLLLFGFILFIY